MSVYPCLTALFLFSFSLARAWTNQMFLGDKGGELCDEWVRGKERLSIGAQRECVCVCIFCLCASSYSISLIRCDLTSPADSSVTLARGRRVSSPACLVSFWTRWLKTSDLRHPLWTPAFVVFQSLPLFFICLFQTLVPFPFLLPLCIPWTLSFCFVLCCHAAFSIFSLLVLIHLSMSFSCIFLLFFLLKYLFLCFSASTSHCLSPSLPFFIPH